MAARSVVRGDRLAPGVALAAAVAGGLLTAAAFPPYAVRPLAVPGTALLLGALHRQSWRPALGYGAAYGLAFFVPLLSWLQVGAGTNAWLILAALEAAIVAAFAVPLARASRLPAWPLWSAATWVAQEAVRGRFPFGGFTWGRLGFSQDSGPLLRWAAIGGVPLVTFWVALAAALLVVFVRRVAGLRVAFSEASVPVAVGALALFAVPYAVAPLLPGAPTADRSVVVAVVQGNVPRLGLASFDPRQQDLVIGNHVAATYQLADDVAAGRVPAPLFVVWPENSTDRDPRTDPEISASISAAAARVGVPILVGAVLDAPHDEAFNAGVVWDPATGFGATYAKRHLVPFGEYVPFRKTLTPLFGRLALVAHDFRPASRDQSAPLDVAGVRVGDVICFEIAYDGLVRDTVRAGADLIVVQTNNASFGRSAETPQQLAMSRLRAVEHGRTVLVAATSGISAVIAPDGHLVDRSRIDTRDLLVHSVPLARGQTIASRIGAWPEWLLVSLAVLALATSTLRRR